MKKLLFIAFLFTFFSTFCQQADITYGINALYTNSTGGGVIIGPRPIYNGEDNGYIILYPIIPLIVPDTIWLPLANLTSGNADVPLGSWEKPLEPSKSLPKY